MILQASHPTTYLARNDSHNGYAVRTNLLDELFKLLVMAFKTSLFGPATPLTGEQDQSRACSRSDWHLITIDRQVNDNWQSYKYSSCCKLKKKTKNKRSGCMHL
jgi:hypothetical protein